MADGNTHGRVNVRVQGHVARIELDNPARLNALDEAMLLALEGSVRQFAADPTVRVVVFAGAGDKAFSSGADLTQLGDAPAPSRAFESAFHAALLAIREADGPTIASIGGLCLGGGLAIALETDFRICHSESSFGIPAARIGLPYTNVESVVRAVGTAWASEMLFTGRAMTSDEALGSGLVNAVVSPDRLAAHTSDVAAAIAANAPLAVRAAKAGLRQLGAPADQRNRDHMDRVVEACLRSADLQEGREAFKERRPASFTGA
jgi:enoyl-CoA hydratase/carnithine racemase